MARHLTATPFLPVVLNYKNLKSAASKCRGCDLFLKATQTVFGVGPSLARLMLVGETPGDQEDLAGKPFVGPAGALLDSSLEEAGLDRKTVYVTNAVKHFRYEERGKRRLHKKPNQGQTDACRPWLLAEIELVAPKLIVCLGATAAQALLGKDFRVSKSRGELIERAHPSPILPTFHPSAVLRAPSDEDRRRMRAEFTGDLKTAAAFLRRK